ncbi:SDR family NAD(P)-dependent oxidoreductase [Streptomyces canus]|uniref:SDR family NAD(P)-dependent oxidoreductase n=1 Tax=Streptomyces sp. SAI-144 TaxID=2940544 RepID=UPI002474EF3D|nr:SDR family oxidoreductase [Streptomyces sp. SAI-144]MDH6435689.1 NAD(P)-dependent dehydrogenase (short-subunit alcohol dehydrogenase family) [Streptomyces sp. SAI-144]
MVRNALVVGGNRGIGQAVALQLAQLGWSVGAASLTGAQDARRAADVAGCRVRPYTVDVRDDASVHRLRRDWDAGHDGLDALVVTAGTAVTGRMAEIEPSDVQAMLDEHVVGAYRLVKSLRESLARRGGHVVLLLSRMGRHPRMYGHAYGTAKSALAHLAGCMAQELADEGVRVNCVSPGAVDTDLLRAALPGVPRPDTMSPAEAAGAVVALLGRDFARVNGAVIDMPGL